MQYKSTTGVYLTRALFWEMSSPSNREQYPPVYTLKEDDHTVGEHTYKSAYQIYMSSIDEYDAAIKLVGSIKHWDILVNSEWFMEGWYNGGKKITMGLKEWRDHKKRKDESLAKRQMLEQAEEGNVTAIKVLYGTQPVTKRKKKEKPAEHDEGLDSNVSDFLKQVGN